MSESPASEASVLRRTLDYVGLGAPARRARRDPDRRGYYGVTVAKLHDPEHEVGPLDAAENRRLLRIKLFGATGTILMLVGSLGTGQIPVLQNPVAGMRVLSLPSRMWSTALTLSIGGTIMLVVAWLLIGRFAVGRFSVEVLHGRSPARRMTRQQADRTLLLWIAPIIVAPPLLSKDIYSYLAQSAIAYRGMDPYTVSPLHGLGVGNVLTRSVPNLWRDTPAPYGPFFIWIGKGITAVTGDNITAAIFLHRLVALVGLALIVWALPRLARRCGVSPVAALWLGAMNPLVILHLVGGIHNEALMLGLMLVGIELCFRAIYGAQRLRTPGSWRPTGAGWLLLAGAAVIATSSLVKFTSVLALGFVGIALAQRWGACLPALRGAPIRQWWARSRATVWALAASAGLLGAVLAVVMVVICVGTGLGFGWTSTLSTGAVVRSWMSMPTLLSVSAGRVGVFLGLGDQTQAILDVVRPLGQVIAAVFVVRWMLATLAGRLHPLGALGVSMATVVVFFPFVQAWYLLWAVIPLAAWATRPWFRIATITVSAIIAIVVMPTSSNTSGVVLAQGLLAGVIMVAVMTALFFEDWPRWRPRRRWSKRPTPEHTDTAA
ncbi:mannosyltransferase MptB [Gordonia polyisoprenivorans NBRC 16320 = JCM 10675]|uniref:Polyprenol phosphomannose-dependent alpha 1,6 mannosyltransferase MptB n=1 Tax=Gordonia polyisoprenivorans TaxID=84595 RepID=A0A846WKT6_9ACTN|nr:polyprenol phosphomannose-dependent alpha 1,6 mannosyltransferase MptB [Gordonia polyisoprenivorans]NKY02294.1 polyprenol phosphomannose-dependent alpha 1,6 mannosyltransferase MptB [Gordonia polyisoprenivorans]WCB39702.1 polyprenol phosphomannose-dependent alpha 1,6 mannosyltransferase MptB [Gordonia polyisoprenivorans]GAB23668.1 mannosyltransferase MptB [Gordonia polyisoprenivorans NBRC 16320 = JCM 10675]